jgi:hypothetical protein
MARNHLMTTLFFKWTCSNGGLLSSVENIAQAPPCGSIFNFCSENKNLGTGVTAALCLSGSPAFNLCG